MEKKQSKITIHHLFWYFLIFSVVGLLLETLYCYVTVGVFESRKGFIWGPLCPVYGVCGTALIWMLEKLNYKKSWKLFGAGFILGSVTEYFLSYMLEAIYGVRFWNYEYLRFNLNGRISLVFSIYWGALSVILMKIAKPLIDKFVDGLKKNNKIIIETIIFIFLVIDCLVTVWGIQTYQNRILYNKVYTTDSDRLLPRIREKIENNYFTNEKMSTIFPNLRIRTENGDEIWIKALMEEQENNKEK